MHSCSSRNSVISAGNKWYFLCPRLVVRKRISRAMVLVRKLGLTASEAVMIGDTPYDAEAASGAGTAAAGVLTGGFSIDALRGAGCFAIADEVSRLLVYLENAKPSRA